MSVWLDISASKAIIIVYSIAVATVSFRAAQFFFGAQVITSACCHLWVEMKIGMGLWLQRKY
jgi:hypothetical protein